MKQFRTSTRCLQTVKDIETRLNAIQNTLQVLSTIPMGVDEATKKVRQEQKSALEEHLRLCKESLERLRNAVDMSKSLETPKPGTEQKHSKEYKQIRYREELIQHMGTATLARKASPGWALVTPNRCRASSCRLRKRNVKKYRI